MTDSKTPAASTDTKVHDGLKPAVGAKPDKPADKPSTEKSSSEKKRFVVGGQLAFLREQVALLGRKVALRL